MLWHFIHCWFYVFLSINSSWMFVFDFKFIYKHHNFSFSSIGFKFLKFIWLILCRLNTIHVYFFKLYLVLKKHEGKKKNYILFSFIVKLNIWKLFFFFNIFFLYLAKRIKHSQKKIFLAWGTNKRRFIKLMHWTT